MLTTLYCDASFCPHDRVGGWAVWLRSDFGRHIESGVVPDYCDFSNEAEFAAIYAGIYRAVTKWPDTSAVLVRSDCTTALQWMEMRYQARSQGGQRLQEHVRKLKKDHDVRLIPRWVKGHRHGKDTDVYLNNRVDEMAGKVMRQERQRVRTNTQERKDALTGKEITFVE